MTANDDNKKLNLIDLRRTKYEETWRLQKKIVALRQEGEIGDVLLFTEHEPVITMGRATSFENLLCSPEQLKQKGVEIHEIERGGDITFHGPGQLVIYPIINLNNHGRDLHKYLRDLENVIIDALRKFGIDSGTKEGLTGVWANNSKLASIGVAVSRWITYHGAALNVNTDLDYFKLINPCGITEYSIGSMASATGKKIDMDKVRNELASSFAAVFNYEIERVESIESLLSEVIEV